MARNLYILAATLLLFSLVCCSMALATPHAGTPSEAPTWKTIGLFLLLGALGMSLLGTLTALFEQVDRRAEMQKMQQKMQGRRPGPSGTGGPRSRNSGS